MGKTVGCAFMFSYLATRHRKFLLLRTQNKSRNRIYDCDFFGGDEENRTPVRKPRPKAFSECS